MSNNDNEKNKDRILDKNINKKKKRNNKKRIKNTNGTLLVIIAIILILGFIFDSSMLNIAILAEGEEDGSCVMSSTSIPYVQENDDIENLKKEGEALKEEYEDLKKENEILREGVVELEEDGEKQKSDIILKDESENPDGLNKSNDLNNPDDSNNSNDLNNPDDSNNLDDQNKTDVTDDQGKLENMSESEDSELLEDATPEFDGGTMVLAASVANPEYRPVGNKHPMINESSWWEDAKSYVTKTFGVVDGNYNTVAGAPPAGSVWCAGLVSRVIYNTYPNGSKIAVTESVGTLYNELVSSGDYDFIAEGYVSDFVDVIEDTKAGDIMLLMSKEADGSWKWTHTNLITWYGYIYSQGAGGKIRMNTFDNYNQYGAYEASLSAGYYYYIYRLKEKKEEKEKSYLGIKKVGDTSGRSYDNIWFEAYDEEGNYLGGYLTGAASDESDGYAFYLRNSIKDLSYVDTSEESAGSIDLPVGSTVYLYEQGMSNGESFTLPDGVTGYAGIKGSSWEYVKGPQKEYYVTLTTVDYDNWTAVNAYTVSEPDDGPRSLTLKKITSPAFSFYTQDKNRFSLEGARYTIASEDNSEIYYLETDSSGSAFLLDSAGKRTSRTEIETKKSGTYYCWETKASKGYKIDPDCVYNKKKSVTVDYANPDGSFISVEEPEVELYGGIEIIKKSTDQEVTSANSNYLLKAVYGVYDSTDSRIGSIITNNEGYGYLGGLSSGTYKIKEETAGDGYELDPSVYVVNVSVPKTGTYIYNEVDYSAVFDPDYYRNRYPDLSKMNNSELLQHFAVNGLSEGRKASAYYDPAYYAKEVGKSNREAYEYFLGYGMYSKIRYAPYDIVGENTSKVYMNSSIKPVVVSMESPEYVAGFNIEKKDSFSKGAVLEGEAELENALFKVNYYSAADKDIDKVKAGSIQPSRSWYIKTVKNSEGKYIASLTDEGLDKTRSNSEFFKDKNGRVILPYGIAKIEEIEAPVGYLMNEIYYDGNSVSEGEAVYIIINENMKTTINIEDTIIRGDIKLQKRDYETDEPMSGVEFEIKSVKTGESIKIITDENGAASTKGMWMSASSDGSEIEEKEGFGALPYGKYIVTELSCDANKGKQLEPPIEINIEEEKVYDAFDPTGDENIIRNVPLPEIATTARIKDVKEDIVPIDREVTFIDTVEYKFLKAGETYTLVGTLMIRDENGEISEYIKNGNVVRVQKSFSVSNEYKKSIFEKSGTVDMEFEGITADGLEGKSFVVYERLYLGNDISEENYKKNYDSAVNDTIIFPVVHENKEDEGQTLHVAGIGTTAHNKDGGKSIIAEEKASIYDTVHYENVTPGEKYKVEGILYDKKTGNPYKVAGKEIRSEAEFTAKNDTGDVEVEFTFDASEMKELEVVVFEKMFDIDGRLVARHEDIDDDDQKIKITSPEEEEPTTTVTTETVTEEKTTEIIKNEERLDNEISTETKVEEKVTIEKKIEEKEVKSSPKTGDNTKLKLGLYLMFVSACVIAYIIYRKNRKAK